MDVLENRQFVNARLTSIEEVCLASTGLVHLFFLDKLAYVVISMYLVDVSVLVSERAFGSMVAHLDREERFAILIASSPLLFHFLGSLEGCKFFIIVGKSATFTVTAASVLDNVLA